MGTKGYKIICGKCGGAGPYVKIEDFANKMDGSLSLMGTWIFYRQNLWKM